MRRIFLILFLASLCVGGWFFWQQNPGMLNSVVGSDFHTFKMRYTAETIMEGHRKELLHAAGSNYLEPCLAYFPYLLMEVKYTLSGAETREGMLLWGLSDGEMVLNVDNWEKSHGFEDCLLAKANENDFKILRALAAAGGTMEKAHLSGENCEEWIASCVKKKLVVEAGTKLRFHLQNPKLGVVPHTTLHEWIVTLNESRPCKSNKRYSTQDVLKMTKLAFGTDFAIRRTKEVYLPVHEIAVQNADGSVLTTYWNALTGKRIDEHLREI